MSFERPEDIWEKKYRNLFKMHDPSDMEVLLNIVSMMVHSREGNTDMSRLYNAVGLENFSKVIDLFDGRTVKFTTKDNFRELLILALCWYYRDMQGMDWNQIQEIMPFEINPVSYGIRLSRFSRDVHESVQEAFAQIAANTDKENDSE